MNSMSPAKKAAFWVILTVLLVGLALVCLKAVDKYLEHNRPIFIDTVVGQGPEDPRRPGIPVVAFTFYPFTGGHTQANFSVQGGKLTSGDHGFHIDFDLDNPPAKPKGEYRVILIGGSAAWGWGVTEDAKTMDRVIERALSACRVRVVNLAMSASIAQQNFIALNQWGHALEPDAVLSFSGNNDMGVPPYPSLPGMALLNGFVSATFPANTPPHLRRLFDRFSGIFEHTGLGLAIRATYVADYQAAFTRDYRARFLGEEADAGDRYRREVPAYVKAHKSIKRDFQGIPIMVAFQPYMARPGNRGRAGMTNEQIAEYLPRYERFIEQAQAQLAGYLNDRWNFFDAHRFYAERMIEHFPPEDGIHMGDAKHEILGVEIARRLKPWACNNL